MPRIAKTPGPPRRITCNCSLHPDAKRVSVATYYRHLAVLRSLDEMQTDQYNNDVEMYSDTDQTLQSSARSRRSSMSSRSTIDGDRSEIASDSDESEPDWTTRTSTTTGIQDSILPLDYLRCIADDNLRCDGPLKQAVQFMQWKQTCCMSSMAYKELLQIGSLMSLPSEKIATGMITESTRIIPQYYDCCVNGCMAFTDEALICDSEGAHNWSSLESCLFCNESRYEEVTLRHGGTRTRARKVFLYIPLIPRLQILSANRYIMEQMKAYRADCQSEGGIYRDIFDATVFKDCQEELFSDIRTIPLGLTSDGITIVREKGCEMWPIVLINYNLPPKDRVKMHNMLFITMAPGPRQPRDLDSFMVPLISELKTLNEGVEAIDGSLDRELPDEQRRFVLKAHLLTASGDGPGITKLMHLTGHRGTYPCRFCWLKGTYSDTNKRYYFPHNDFVMERRTDMIEDYHECALGGAPAQETGHTGRLPMLLHLKHSLRWPESFAQDPMHLLTNISRLMVEHWQGLLQTPSFTDARSSYVLPKKVWEDIGEEMVQTRLFIPSSLCRRPRSIAKHYRSFKAKEWESWTFMFSIPLLRGRLPDYALSHWTLFVKAMYRLYKRQLTESDRQMIEDTFERFIRVYEGIYHQHPIQLSHCRAQIHYLMHLADSVDWLGPAFVFSQSPCERYVGTLEAKATSRSHLDVSMQNTLLKETNLLYFQYSHNQRCRIQEQANDVLFLGASKLERLPQPILTAIRNHLNYTTVTNYSEVFGRVLLRNQTIGSDMDMIGKIHWMRSNSMVEFQHEGRVRYGKVRKYLRWKACERRDIDNLAIIAIRHHQIDEESQMPLYIGNGASICIDVRNIIRLVGLVGSHLGARTSGSTPNDSRKRQWIVGLSSDIA